MMTDRQPQPDPVRKTLWVACRRELAFEVFTARLADWWPLETHSVCLDTARDVILEPRVGGRLYEVCADGAQHNWGKITAWEPPTGFACTWHPGRNASQATQLQLRFAAEDQGTRVDLTHHGWEALGDLAQTQRTGYDKGWERVFGERYRDAIASATAGCAP